MFNMYKSKLNLLMELVLSFIKFRLQGHCHRELTILLFCVLYDKDMSSFYLKNVDRFLLIATHLHPVYACANTPTPSLPVTPETLVSLRVFMTVSPYNFFTYKGIEFCLL